MENGVGLEGVRFAVVDLETTGLRQSRHHILQVGVVTVDIHGHELDQWSTYVKPPHWPFARLGARHIHGISRPLVRHAPTARNVLAELAERVEGTVLTAHNMAFDLGFIRHGAQRYGVAFPASPLLCTLTVSRSLDPERQLSHRLGDVCLRYAVGLDRPHDALADAQATSAVLPYLLKDAGITTWEQLLAAQPSV